MRKILILAYYFPPIAASGSLRPAGFCAHLPSLGYEPTVLSANYEEVHPTIAIDPSLNSLVHSDLDVRLVSHINWQKRLLTIRDKFRNFVGTPANSSTIANDGDNQEISDPRFSLKAAVLDRLFRFPDQQRAWSNAVVQYAGKLPSSERPDIVLATGNPWSALIAGAKIANSFRVPFVADFRDPWVNNPKPPLSPSLGRKAEKLEKKVIIQASRVIANTPELADSFSARYTEQLDKFTTITNGFHSSLLKTFEELPEFEDKDDRLELCYFGSIYELRKPTTLLSALKALLDADTPGADRLLLRFTGNWIVSDTECNALASELETRNALIREPNVDHRNYLARLKASKLLLILQQGFPLQIPGKIYEYMASGRPIVVIGGEGATANLVNSRSLGKVCRNDEESIIELLRNLLLTADQIKSTSPEVLGGFSYPALTEILAKELDTAHHAFRNLC